jgi:hypothetical protein
MWRRFFKLLFYIVLSLYVIFIATFLAVLRAAEWHGDLSRFLYHVWVTFLSYIGSTGPGFVSPIILAVLSIVLTLVAIGFLQGWAAMLRHWWETALVTGVVLVTTMLAVYGPQFIWEVVKVAREDHRALASWNEQLIAHDKDLSGKLKDAQDNAEQRCEAASNVSKDLEIHRLRKLLNAGSCFNPDRNLTPMDESRLFKNLKALCAQMEKQKQPCAYRLTGFAGDAEGGRLSTKLWPIFQGAGWQPKPSLPPNFTPAQLKQVQTEQAEQEQWMRDHGLTEGIFVFDKNWPKGFGMSLAFDFSQVDLADWTYSNQEYVKVLPHMDGLTVWVGYKHVQSH